MALSLGKEAARTISNPSLFAVEGIDIFHQNNVKQNYLYLSSSDCGIDLLAEKI